MKIKSTLIIISLVILLLINMGVSQEITQSEKINMVSTSIYLRSGGDYWINPYNMNNYYGDNIQVERWVYKLD